jgi:hypothetical protein
MKVCHACGATLTERDRLLKKDYCSSACHERSVNRRFKGDTFYSSRAGLSDEEEETHSISNIYNPFKSLFEGE